MPLARCFLYNGGKWGSFRENLHAPLGKSDDNDIHDNDDNKPETRFYLSRRPRTAVVRGGEHSGTSPDTSSLDLFHTSPV